MRRIDVAILTAKAEEHRAVLDRLHNVTQYPGLRKTPNQYAWTCGEIPSTRSAGAYRVVVGVAPDQTNTVSAVAAMSAYATFEPRYLMFVGIAGGLDKNLHKGDVFVADYIRSYEYGSLDDDGFSPRHKFQEETDQALRAAAAAFNVDSDWPKEVGEKPDASGFPELFFGGLASGEKVVESADAAGFAPVLAGDPRLGAVEMESAGLAAAVQHLRSEGHPVGLMIVRGISDTPSVPGVPTSTNRLTRHQWTNFASRAAAGFLVSFIANAFPYPPDEGDEESQDGRQLESRAFLGYTSHFVTIREMPDIHRINERAFDSSVQLLPRPQLESWWRANPFSIRRVMTSTGQSVGYWNVVPVVREAYLGLAEGMHEGEVTDRQILSYDAVQRGALYLYVGAIVDSNRSAATSAAIILDLVAFLRILDRGFGINALCAQSVADDAVQSLVNFHWRQKAVRERVTTWVLDSRPVIERAFREADRHMRALKGLRPLPVPQEESAVRRLLKR